MAKAGTDFFAFGSLQGTLNLLFEICRYGRCKDVPLTGFWARCLGLFYCLLFFLGELASRVRRFLRYILFFLGGEIVIDPFLKFLGRNLIALLCDCVLDEQNRKKAQ